jgi:hypothetical protein
MIGESSMLSAISRRFATGGAIAGGAGGGSRRSLP